MVQFRIRNKKKKCEKFIEDFNKNQNFRHDFLIFEKISTKNSKFQRKIQDFNEKFKISKNKLKKIKFSKNLNSLPCGPTPDLNNLLKQ